MGFQSHRFMIGQVPVASSRYFCTEVLFLNESARKDRPPGGGAHLLLLRPAAYDLQVLERVEVRPVFRPGLNQQRPWEAEGRGSDTCCLDASF